MRKALGAALACLLLALALTIAAGTGLLEGARDRGGNVHPVPDSTQSLTETDLSGAPSPAPPPIHPSAAPSAAAPAETASEKAVSYFAAVVFSSEYGGTEEDDGRIRKWTKPVRIAVSGNPTKEDLSALDAHIADLAGVPGMPDIRRVVSDGNVLIHFVPLSGMSREIPGYVEGNWGFFRVWWDEDLRIVRAEVGIASDVTTQEQRNHLILEETTQMLGIMQDTDLYEDSIFYAPWTLTQSLSAIDWQVVGMLYRPDILPGMTAEESVAQLREGMP